MGKRLLLVGADSIHVQNYLALIEGYFEEVWVISHGDKYVYKNHTILDYSVRNPFVIASNARKINQLIQSFRPDVIHLQNIGTGAYHLWKAIKRYNIQIPTVATAWGSDVLVSPKRSFVFRKIVKHILDDFDFFTADAHYMLYEMNRMANRTLPAVIANFGIDQDLSENQYHKEKIIYSNRLHHSLYRIDVIIDLFFDFLDLVEDKSWKLVIAATGSETENLKQKVSQSVYADSVHFAGWIQAEENKMWYQKAQIYISIPESDGTSISLLEAMWHGCLPIVSNVPANLEWITPEFNGIVWTNGEQNPFLQILKLSSNDVHVINRKIVEIHGSKEANRAKFIRIYDQLTKNKKELR